ncbi:MAG TPA: acyltransferase [Acidimicrobiia bacterium]
MTATVAAPTPAEPALEVPARAKAARFEGFDGLRAIAAFAVVAHHASLPSAAMTTGHFDHQFTELDVGVAIFFLISGYLLYRPFLERMIRDDAEPPVGGYLLRRAARIFPAYWLALTTIILVGHFTHGKVLGFPDAPIRGGVFTYPRYYLLLHVYRNLHEAASALNQAWTLAVEITFYVFLPIFAALMRRISRSKSVATRLWLQMGVLAAMYVASTGFRAWCFYGSGRVHAVGQYWLPANLDLFALGMAVAVVAVGIQVEAWPRRVVTWVERWPALFWAAGIVLFYVAANKVNVGLVPGPTPEQSMYRHAMQGVVALLLLLPVVFRGPRPSIVSRILDWRPLVYCGVVSYGIYLWHQSFLDQAIRSQFKPPFHASMALLLTYAIPVSVVVASISWFVVERRAVRWASRRGSSTRGARADAAPTRPGAPSAATPAPSGRGA